ncbi:MAG: tripartite tricarboxylate transporter substrate binding protein [Burkholderiales bacterium]|nr:tripartite tricarboxylate transporter substrate binding protein [Burkholderiales bacterium]MDP2398224.1 tripartite tricarboxylate transporter substrate binding protein [Burkholderiales bacterium]
MQHRLLVVLSRSCLIMAATLFTALAAQAAEWQPGERVVLATHAGPGSGIDMFLRQVANAWEKNKLISSRISVENMSGAGGDRARRHVAVQSRGNPNVLIGFTPQLIVGPLNAKSDVTVKSFTPVAIAVVEPMVLYIHAGLPWKNMKDMIAGARQKPRAVLQGGGGFGAPPSIAGRDLAREMGVEFSYTPFRSSAEAVVALLGGHVHFVLEQPSETDQHVKSGRLRPLASLYPSELYPGLPTFASLGYKFRVLKQFRGLMAPPGIAPEAVAYYVSLMERTRQTPEWKNYVKQNELVEEWIVGADLAAFIDSEEKRYAGVLAEIAAKK